FAVSAQGSYLVTGGLGGIGLLVAKWLVARGARHLALTGRRGMETPGAVQSAAELEAQGVQVRVAAVDVTDFEAMRTLISAIEPPLRGVLHCAGVGPVCPLVQTTDALLHSTLQPKVTGSIVLHRLMQNQALDFFVLFSS